MRCLETALGLALLALGATATWGPSCEPCKCIISGTLQTAYCRDKALTSVPKFPVDTQQIQIVGRNNISSLQGKEFDGYSNLTHIWLKQNPLTELPSGIFSKLINVIEIWLPYNKIKILQSHLFSNLMDLKLVWLEGNQISVLENNCFFNVPQLTEIRLDSNNLTKINQSFINEYCSLETLHFSDNPVQCDDSICELMNRVVQRKLYVGEAYMPRCAGPPSVQGQTWRKAVEALWGACPVRCPAGLRGPSTAGPPEPTRGPEDEMKDAGLQLPVAELNKTMTEVTRVLGALHAELLGLKAEQEELKGVVDVLVKETKNGREAATTLFKEEMNKARSAASNELQLLQEELRQTQSASNALCKEELNNSRNEVRRVLQEQEQLKGAVDVLVREIQTLFKTEMDKTKREVERALWQTQEALKEDLNKSNNEVKRVLQEQEQLKGAVDELVWKTQTLFKTVYQWRSGAQGLLLLRYSVLPSPDTTQPPK